MAETRVYGYEPNSGLNNAMVRVYVVILKKEIF